MDAVVAGGEAEAGAVENAIHDSLRRDKNNLKLLLDVGVSRAPQQ